MLSAKKTLIGVYYSTRRRHPKQEQNHIALKLKARVSKFVPAPNHEESFKCKTKIKIIVIRFKPTRLATVHYTTRNKPTGLFLYTPSQQKARTCIRVDSWYTLNAQTTLQPML